MPSIIRKFGYNDEKEWTCCFCINSKGSMDDKEFTNLMMEDELKLKEEMNMKDTVVEQLEAVEKRQLVVSVYPMDKEEWASMRSKLDELDNK